MRAIFDFTKTISIIPLATCALFIPTECFRTQFHVSNMIIVRPNQRLHLRNTAHFNISSKTPNKNSSRGPLKTFSQRQKTSLNASILTTIASSSTTKAALGLTISSLLGILSDRRLKWIGDGNGIIITLLVASLCSNFGFVPANHFLYDLCWSHLLPMSLALLLLTNAESNKKSDSETIKTTSPSQSTSITTPIGTKSILKQVRDLIPPFFIGCIGSIIGCIGSFFLFSSFPKSVLLNSFQAQFTPKIAALAAGCLCSSYIGGSINFFSTAKILSMDLNNASNYGMHSNTDTIFSAMAASDIIIMAIYFSFLSWSMSSKKLWKWFPKQQSLSTNSQSFFRSKKVPEDTINSEQYQGSQYQNKDASNIGGMAFLLGNVRNHLLCTSIITISIANVIVYLSKALEKKVNWIFPGSGCAFIAILSTFTSQLLQNKSSSRFQVLNEKQKHDMNHLISPFFSSLCFHLLFAAIGVNVELFSVLSQGAATLLFATFALLIHIAFIFGGIFFWNKLGSVSKAKVSLDELTVASNAAIGGPATAATFAASIFERNNNSGLEVNNTAGAYKATGKKGLVLAATVWGVVGYAIGTTIGVGLTRFLMFHFCS